MPSSLATPPEVLCGPIPEPFLRAIVRAITVAWGMVCSSSFHDFADEDKTTTRIQQELFAILERRPGSPVVPLFDDSRFDTPQRDAKHTNYDRTQDDKMPDFRLQLSGVGGRPRPHRALFVECKVLDQSRKLDKYCKFGIMRFVDGRYAYRMPHALMVGYVLHHSASLPSSLVDFFERDKAECAKLCAPITCQWVNSISATENSVYETTHSRRFPNSPGPIALFHLWLETPAPQ